MKGKGRHFKIIGWKADIRKDRYILDKEKFYDVLKIVILKKKNIINAGYLFKAYEGNTHKFQESLLSDSSYNSISIYYYSYSSIPYSSFLYSPFILA